MAAMRETLVKEAAELINAEKVKALQATTRLTQQLADMQRRLERRTPHELGEPAEVTCSSSFRRLYRIASLASRRVQRGQTSSLRSRSRFRRGLDRHRLQES